jgi:hypothetical protein
VQGRPPISPWKWWIAIAGTAPIAGGVAWLSKLWVIVATDGRVVATGAAATFLDLGLYLLIVGSTGIGVRLMMNQEPSMRVVLAVASPLVLLGVGYALGAGIGDAILVIGGAILGVAVPAYLLAEAGILGLALIGLLAGIWLVVYVMPRGAAQGTRGTSGSLGAESQPRVR